MKSELKLGDEATGRKLLGNLHTHLPNETLESIHVLMMFARNRFLRDPKGVPATLREFEHYRWMCAIPQLIDWAANLELYIIKRLVNAEAQDNECVYDHLRGSDPIPGVPRAPTPSYVMQGYHGEPKSYGKAVPHPRDESLPSFL